MKEGIYIHSTCKSEHTDVTNSGCPISQAENICPTVERRWRKVLHCDLSRIVVASVRLREEDSILLREVAQVSYG
jgi:hypothetical protein